MPTYEVSLPDQMDSKIDRVVQEGEFLNREQAIEELLTRGISVYNETNSTTDDGFDEGLGSGDDYGDPALRDDPDDGRTF